MNNLKFRYYDSYLKSFVYSEEFEFENPFERLRAFFGKATNYADVVQQFTGLKDKNGREVFEGDILSYKRRGGIMDDPTIYIHEIGYENWQGVKYLKFKNSGSPLNSWNFLFDTFEVIGNIYENPELMK